MVFLANSPTTTGGPDIDFWTALVSFLTAVVLIAGPSLLRKLSPPDTTVAEIAKTSSTRIADSLDTTLKIVKDDIGGIRKQVEENGRKLDAMSRGTK
jgi:hypothetical protein